MTACYGGCAPFMRMPRVLWGAAGFARTVVLSVLAYNVHRYGVLVRDELRLRRKLKRTT